MSKLKFNNKFTPKKSITTANNYKKFYDFFGILNLWIAITLLHTPTLQRIQTQYNK